MATPVVPTPTCRAISASRFPMIIHQDPAQNTGSGLLSQRPYSIYKGLSILLIPEDIYSIDSPHHNMVQGPGDIQTSFSRHSSLLFFFALPVKYFLN